MFLTNTATKFDLSHTILLAKSLIPQTPQKWDSNIPRSFPTPKSRKSPLSSRKNNYNLPPEVEPFVPEKLPSNPISERLVSSSFPIIFQGGELFDCWGIWGCYVSKIKRTHLPSQKTTRVPVPSIILYFHPSVHQRPRELRAPAASIKGDSWRPSVQTLTSAPLAKASNIALKVGWRWEASRNPGGMLVEHII